MGSAGVPPATTGARLADRPSCLGPPASRRHPRHLEARSPAGRRRSQALRTDTMKAGRELQPILNVFTAGAGHKNRRRSPHMSEAKANWFVGLDVHTKSIAI